MKQSNDNIPYFCDSICGKNILITGAGGSIGSELCKKLAQFSPRSLILADICENGIFDLCEEFNELGFHDFQTEIFSVTDRDASEKIFRKYNPNIVFHAAAHKHVPLMERCPAEAVKNNVFGTKNIAELSVKYNCEKFVLISTDKAVNPSCVMGATKRLCEYIVAQLSHLPICKTAMITVRFGNVLGSNGSVVPVFERQIKSKSPITVTDKNCTRYFMTVSEAVELVISAADLATGGELFVLDMGEPINVYELALRLIKVHGYELDKDIEIVFTGLRPGEKIHEELFYADEAVKRIPNSRIFVCNDGVLSNVAALSQAKNAEKMSRELFEACEKSDDNAVLKILHTLFTTLLNN